MDGQLILSQIPISELENRLVTRIKDEILSSLNVNQEPQPDELLTVRETAKLLGVSKTSIHNWMSAGLIKYYRYGSRIRFKKAEILQVEKYQTKGKQKKEQ